MKFGFVTKSETSVVVAAVSGTAKESGVVAAVKRIWFVGGLKNEGSFGWGGGPRLNEGLLFNDVGIFGWGGGPRLNEGLLFNDGGIFGWGGGPKSNLDGSVCSGETGVVAAVKLSSSCFVAVLWNALLPL